MPAIIVTEPGVVLPTFTAGAVAASQDFTLQGRSNALVGLQGDNPWAVSSDQTNYFNVGTGEFFLLPVLDGQGKTRTWYFKRTGAVDATISTIVAG